MPLPDPGRQLWKCDDGFSISRPGATNDIPARVLAISARPGGHRFHPVAARRELHEAIG